MHPLLQLLMTQPGLLGEHAQGYVELLAGEVTAFKQAGQQRLCWTVATAFLALTGVVLGGVAFMLWAVHPGLPTAAHWLLWGTPAVPLAAALACLFRLRALHPEAAFANLQQQIKADMQLLKEVNAP